MRDRSSFGPRLAALLAAGVAAAPAWAGPTFEEIPDAGSTPGTSQPVTGPSGGVGRIKGELNGTADSPDFEDVYLINIVDPIGFSATVDPTGTNFDTQLWLFNVNGFGLLSNDNNPLAFPTIFSRVAPPATDGTGQIVPGPGLYLLAISSKENKPLSGAGPIFNDQSSNGTEVSGPDGVGASQPLQTWSHAPGTVAGQYSINLTGVDFLELPCDVQCPLSATEDADAFQCGLVPDPNGGCGEPGNPLQNLGTLSPTSYLAACGTTGTVMPNARDLDWYRFHLNAPAFVKATLVHNVAEGVPAPNAELFILQGDQCPTQDVVFSATSSDCPLVSEAVPLPAGDHVVIVTVDAFAPAGPLCPVEYLLWLTAANPPHPGCGNPGAGPCGIPHPTPRCSDLGCCETVCAIDPSCCDSNWDLGCATIALAQCLDAPYSCTAGGGVPPNDCAPNAMLLAIGSVATSDTTFASTDGPDDAPECAPGKDVWYRVFAPTAGKLHLSLCGATNFDSTMAVYELGASPTVDPTAVFDGTHLVGCDDDGCGVVGGASQLDVTVPADGLWYLVRVGGHVNSGVPASGISTITASLAQLVYTTGATHKTMYDANSAGNYAPTHVGLSSGKLSPAQPQRWMAQPFTVPPGPNGSGYRITEIHGYGFSPTGSTNQTLNYIVWKRAGTTRPLNGDQLVTGAVPFPAPSDLPIAGSPADEDHMIALAPGFDLGPGNYWLTLYADNALGPAVVANFAWFLCADNGINVLDSANNPFAWRSAAFPEPGFQAFTLPTTTLQQYPGQDPKDLYNAGFTLCGVPRPSVCVGDFDGDGIVGGADLAILLGAWGRCASCSSCPADLTPDCAVNGADLAVLLGAWGPCPR
ncbi:MAG: hypothetical protein U0572_12385 [Phycisphaerales bacterium]